MRFIIDISHPAHYHFFKNAIKEWSEHGHEIRIVSRDKDITQELLNNAGIEHQCLSSHKPGMFSMMGELIQHEWRLHKIIRKFKPDALMQISGTFIVHVGKLSKAKTIVFSNMEKATISNLITYPFADVICTPEAYKNIRNHQVKYPGYHSLAYLHPNRFTPDSKVLIEASISFDEVFSIVRFVSWSSSHDVALHGFTKEGKIKLVHELIKFGKVFISSEEPLPLELKPYIYQLPKNKIHHLMAGAALIVGESATMASEGAILGVPQVYLSPVPRCYTTEMEQKYGMVFNFTNEYEGDAISKCAEILSVPNRKAIWKERQHKMLSERIDVTEWMVNFVEDFAKS